MMDAIPAPTVGRILHAYSSTWNGPRAALVLKYRGGTKATVKVFSADSPDVVLGDIQVLPAQNQQDREVALQKWQVFCEWPPRS